MRKFQRRLSIILFSVFVLAGLQEHASCDHGREILPRSWQQDATVNDVFYLNATHGWVVGDQGLILRTTNGGKDWISSEDAGLDLDDDRSLEQKLSVMRPISQTHELYPLTCSLKSVFFVNEKRGWIAGNYYSPYLDATRSVLLATGDGGKTWKQLKGSILPQINRIYFQDVLGGWAIGRSGSLFNTGICATSSGGRLWSVQSVDQPRHLIDGELVPNGFVVIDDEGALGRVIGSEYEPSIVVGKRPGKLQSIRMFSARIGWAVGSAGTILLTTDGGQSWKRPDFSNNERRIRQFDFSSVTIRGDRVWAAGNPGTIVFSFDAATGKNLKWHATNVSLPISKLYFSSDRAGTAVGANGLIMATNDGGENWEVQRLVNDRVAIMATTADPQDQSLACLSVYSNEENKLSSSVIVGMHSGISIALANAATDRVGCSLQLNLRGDQLKDEKPTSDTNRIVYELVRTIRTLRPNVFICNPSDNSSLVGIDFELTCRTAIELASNIEAYTDQIDLAGLSCWQVDRFLIRREGSIGEIKFEGNRYLPRSGKLLEDQIAISRGYLNQSSVFNALESYQTESFTGSVSVQHNDVFFGLEQLGHLVPMREDTQRMGNLNSIATAPLKQKEFGRLLSMARASEEDVLKVQSEIREFGTGQESRESGIWLLQLAEEFIDVGEMELAAYTMEQLVTRAGNHPFAQAALMWLTQYYSSDEVTAAILASHDRQSVEPLAVDDLPIDFDDSEIMFASSIPTVSESDNVKQVAWQPENQKVDLLDETLEPLEKELNGLSQASIEAVSSWRIRKANSFLARLKQTDLDFAQNPKVKFMEAMLARKNPADVSNQNILKRIRRTGGTKSDYGFAASRELRTGNKNYVNQLSSCFYATTRPVLDGDLNDDLWQQALEEGKATFLTMRPFDQDQREKTDVCWLAYDDEFLFLAVRCNRLSNQGYIVPAVQRKRDATLIRNDRVQLVLDFDRDFQSAFTFEIDCRGWASESCAGSLGWNPDWFVAVDHDEHAWTLECAIPFAELTVDKIDESTLAAFSLSRLDSNSINLWSQAKTRLPVKSKSGMVAGLSIDPRKFEFLRFAIDPETASDFQKLK